MKAETRERLRAAVRFFYDLQGLRIRSLQRGKTKTGDAPPIELTEEDKAFIEKMGEGLNKLERDALKEVERHASTFGIYDWLIAHRGVGPTMAGVLLAEFDIERATRPSQFWAYAGLHTEEGSAPRPRKGEKLKWNRWLRTKVLFVLGGAFLKSNNEEYRKLYDDYKHRKETQLGPCALCEGTGQAAQPKRGRDGKVSTEAGKKKKCWNCVGDKENPGAYTPERAPWGRGAAHRHQASIRYMVKMFLADLWRAWREEEGLEIVPTYHEAKQGHVHGE